MKASVRKLRDHGNTVLLVEHHKEMIQIADHIVDMGPGSGMEGGRILYEGDYAGLLRSDTLTGRMLGENTPLKESLRIPSGWFTVKHARLHNLKDVTVDLPPGFPRGGDLYQPKEYRDQLAFHSGHLSGSCG